MYCCEQMRKSAKRDEGYEVAIVHHAQFKEYGLSVLDGGSSYITINFCPFCGKKLPISLRDKLFDEIESGKQW